MRPQSLQVEALGLERLKTALTAAGLELATPDRDVGVDLIAYRWHPETGDFRVLPIQMKAASGFIFGVDRKYERIPYLVIAYEMNVVGTEQSIYAMTFAEAEEVAEKHGWTNTKSWAAGYYVQTSPSKRLVSALSPYLMAPGNWGRFVPAAAPTANEERQWPIRLQRPCESAWRPSEAFEARAKSRVG